MSPTARTLKLYPWFKFCQNLLFWQATWFLFFQNTFSAAEAILLYAVFDLASTIFEVPSGWMSDRVGRRPTLVLSVMAGALSSLLQGVGDTFAVFVLAQILLGISFSFVSGTDSALLYETLAAEGRTDEVEAQELRAWRASFAALAVAAVIGGIAAFWWERLPYLMTFASFLVALVLVLRMSEAPSSPGARDAPGFRDALSLTRNPVLAWLFALAVLMYGFSHIPFVFGQPFILSALDGIGLAGEAPAISGAVTAVMMVVSLATSLIAVRLRRMLGLSGVLLLAFALQVALAAILAVSNAVFVIAVLFLRMVPSSLSGPFIVARIQPLVGDAMRATYLSLQSLVGRIAFAASLWLASVNASETSSLSFDQLQAILIGYVIVGCVSFVALALMARRIALDT